MKTEVDMYGTDKRSVKSVEQFPALFRKSKISIKESTLRNKSRIEFLNAQKADKKQKQDVSSTITSGINIKRFPKKALAEHNRNREDWVEYLISFLMIQFALMTELNVHTVPGNMFPLFVNAFEDIYRHLKFPSTNMKVNYYGNVSLKNEFIDF